MVSPVNPEQIATQMLNYYDWCIYHDILIMGDSVKVLGHRCDIEYIKTRDINIISTNMVKLGYNAL